MTTDNLGSLDVGAMFRELPARREIRWALLAQFVAAWHGPLVAADGVSSASIDAAEALLGFGLPAALREWHLLAGKRTSIWSCQDHLLLPEELKIEGPTLTLCEENQSVVRWFLRLGDLSEEDPPVYVTAAESADRWLEALPSVSSFALSQLLSGAKFAPTTKFTANGPATAAALAVIAQRYARLDFPDLSWPLAPTRFYGGDDLVIETSGAGWLWVSGQSRGTFQDALDCLSRAGVGWVHISEP